MPSLTEADARERARTITVQHHAVDLDLTRGPEVFGCTSTIRFRCHVPGASTFLDVRPHRLHAARLNGEPLDVARWDDGRLRLDGLAGHNEVQVSAEMAYSHDGEGLHRSVDPADGRVYVYAMSFLDAAPRAFACFDQPDLKAPYGDFDHPAGVDGGRQRRGAAGRHRPLASGRDQAAVDVPGDPGRRPVPQRACRARRHPARADVRRSLAAHLDRDAEEILTVTRQAFDAYHRLFGIRYPFGEYHQAFVPGFNAGAMENPGCVTLRDTMVFRSRVTDGERGNRARTIVHEMAHQWFGDLVTMRWWDDLWLNESFAELLAHRVCAEATDFADAWVDFALTRKRWGIDADQRPTTHPVAGNGAADAATALVNFDGISYAKGAAVLKQLNAHLGDTVFIDGLRRYVERHAYGNATLADLLSAWAEAGAPDVHGWAAGWLRLPGVDTLCAEEDADGAVLLRRASPPSSPARRPHTLTLAAFAEDSARDEAQVVVRDDTTTVGLPRRGGPRAVVPDVHDETWAKVRLGAATVGALPRLLPRVNDPVARAVAWNALTYAVDDAELDPHTALAVLEAALPHEDPDIALSVLLGWAIGRLRGRYLPPGAADDRLAALAETVLRRSPPGSGAQVAAPAASSAA